MATERKHPTETPEYWEARARSERTFAKNKRGLRCTVESIEIHLRNARDYEAQAKKLRAEQQ